jgi:hypothetical protein
MYVLYSTGYHPKTECLLKNLTKRLLLRPRKLFLYILDEYFFLEYHTYALLINVNNFIEAQDLTSPFLKLLLYSKHQHNATFLSPLLVFLLSLLLTSGAVLANVTLASVLLCNFSILFRLRKSEFFVIFDICIHRHFSLFSEPPPPPIPAISKGKALYSQSDVSKTASDSWILLLLRRNICPDNTDRRLGIFHQSIAGEP